MGMVSCLESGRRIARILVVSLTLVFAVGCGDSKDFLKTYPVEGKVTLQGKPMSHALVTFYPIEGEAKARLALPHGTAEEDGSFKLGTYSVGDGAPAGRYAVTVTWPNGPESRMGMPGYVADQLQGRYGDAKKSTIEFTIEEQKNELPLIDLK